MSTCKYCRKAGCRASRPLCRVRRKVKPNQRACECAGYHFPHRVGSPQCQSNPGHAEAMWAKLDERRTVIR